MPNSLENLGKYFFVRYAIIYFLFPSVNTFDISLHLSFFYINSYIKYKNIIRLNKLLYIEKDYKYKCLAERVIRGIWYVYSKCFLRIFSVGISAKHFCFVRGTPLMENISFLCYLRAKQFIPFRNQLVINKILYWNWLNKKIGALNTYE